MHWTYGTDSFPELVNGVSQQTEAHANLLCAGMHRLAKMSEGSLHADIYSDNAHAALHGASSHNWAAGAQNHRAGLGMAFPFSIGRLENIDAFGFQCGVLARKGSVLPLARPGHFSQYCAIRSWQAWVRPY